MANIKCTQNIADTKKALFSIYIRQTNLDKMYIYLVTLWAQPISKFLPTYSLLTGYVWVTCSNNVVTHLLPGLLLNNQLLFHTNLLVRVYCIGLALGVKQFWTYTYCKTESERKIVPIFFFYKTLFDAHEGHSWYIVHVIVIHSVSW